MQLIAVFPTLLLTFLCGMLAAQTVETDSSGQLILRANARTVVLDVVVSGKKGQPVRSLSKQGFQISEDGRPQVITSFEEHTGEASPRLEAPSALPPSIFTNIPRVAPADAVTVLLLDSLNTPLDDQTRVHREALKYLGSIEPGHRLAIFTLGSRLRYVQGFTDDPSLLKEALASAARGGGPKASLLLQSTTEETAERQAYSHLGGAGAALENFAQVQTAARDDLRVRWTFQAFQQLARYLSGIPGRKNVAWFSGAFPMVLFPNAEIDNASANRRDYGDEVREVDAALVAAHVAIYPIAAEGLAGDSLYDAATQLVGVHSAKEVQDASNRQRQDEVQRRNAEHTAMDQIASETGGEAVFNSNGLRDALARVVDHGSYFYTLSYTPADSTEDGRFRKIRVKLAEGNYTLAYRRGYYAADTKRAGAIPAKPDASALQALMGAGTPESTQIPIALRVSRSLASYAVDFVIAVSGLQLTRTVDGGRQGKLEAMLVVYDQEGRPLRTIVRQVDLTMDAARYARVERTGINFRLEIDAPKGSFTLRGGIRDWASKKCGTLEVQTNRVFSVSETGIRMPGP